MHKVEYSGIKLHVGIDMVTTSTGIEMYLLNRFLYLLNLLDRTLKNTRK